MGCAAACHPVRGAGQCRMSVDVLREGHALPFSRPKYYESKHFSVVVNVTRCIIMPVDGLHLENETPLLSRAP